jgi:hypothetical protein
MALQGNIVRTLDATNDWTLGNNLSGYLSGNLAIRQQIQCRLNQFLGECFWDANAGINWFGFLGGKNAAALNLAIATVIINTTGVTALKSLKFNVNPVTRVFSVNWKVDTVFSKDFEANQTLGVAA